MTYLFFLKFSIFLDYVAQVQVFFKLLKISKIFSDIFLEKKKNPHIIGPAQFKPILFKGQWWIFNMYIYQRMGSPKSFPYGAVIKNLPAMQELREPQEMQVQFLGWEDPLEEGMATHSRFLPRESHGQRSLAGYSPWSQSRS